jgi:hypothetical protein
VLPRQLNGVSPLRVARLTWFALLLCGCGSAAPGVWPPQLWKLPAGLTSGSRVRVIAPRLGTAWQPGQTVLSTEGCWTVQVAVTNDPDAITGLTPGELTRLQLSQGNPMPEWWAVPDDAEGWTEISPHVIEDASAPACKRRPKQVHADSARARPAAVQPRTAPPAGPAPASSLIRGDHGKP